MRQYSLLSILAFLMFSNLTIAAVDITIEYEDDTCTEDWECTAWSECVNGVQNRVCTDSNGCGATFDKPAESQSCTIACTEDWHCTVWSECVDYIQTRTCTDYKNCGTTSNKPTESKACVSGRIGGGGGGGLPSENEERLNFLSLFGSEIDYKLVILIAVPIVVIILVILIVRRIRRLRTE
jgi:hypothetical protein